MAHAATGAERERLWERYRAVDKDLDAFAARRSTETAVVVLVPGGPGGSEPGPARPAPGAAASLPSPAG